MLTVDILTVRTVDRARLAASGASRSTRDSLFRLTWPARSGEVVPLPAGTTWAVVDADADRAAGLLASLAADGVVATAAAGPAEVVGSPTRAPAARPPTYVPST